MGRALDLIGKKFGYLTVIEKTQKEKMVVLFGNVSVIVVI